MATIEEACKTNTVKFGEHELKFEVSEFGEEYEARARKELRETPENVADGLDELRKLIKSEVGLRIPDDDVFLKMFLRPCKFYPDSAFQLIHRHYKFKLKHPKYFRDLLPSNEKAAFNQNLLTVLPMRNRNGKRVLIVQCGRKWNPKTCTLLSIVRSIAIILDAAIAEARTQVSGADVILDMDGLSLNHIWQFTPSLAKEILEFVQDCLPIRLKGVHIVNQPYIFNMLFAIFKPFLREKLRNRIHFHGTNFSSLHSHMDKQILPKKYGGSADISVDMGEQIHNYMMVFEPECKIKLHEGYIDKNN